MERPYIICHMVTSIDGRVTGDFLSTVQGVAASEVYYEINRSYKADAYACGRVTMEGSFTLGKEPKTTTFKGTKIEKVPYIADNQAKFFAVAFDRRGRLGWESSKITDEDPGYDNAHIIEVLCENAPDEYLAYLKSIGVSYIFAGEKEMDVALALAQLKKLFGIEKLLLEGGSIINGAFMAEGLIDEVSLVVAPVSAATEDKPLFYIGKENGFKLKEVKQYGDIVWLNYIKE